MMYHKTYLDCKILAENQQIKKGYNIEMSIKMNKLH